MTPPPEPLDPLLRGWLHESGAVSALPDAPVAPDAPAWYALPLSWLPRRRAGRPRTSQAPADVAVARPSVVPARVC